GGGVPGFRGEERVDQAPGGGLRGHFEEHASSHKHTVCRRQTARRVEIQFPSSYLACRSTSSPSRGSASSTCFLADGRIFSYIFFTLPFLETWARASVTPSSASEAASFRDVRYAPNDLPPPFLCHSS